jgi:chemotaxis protein histidine kinase CheA
MKLKNISDYRQSIVLGGRRTLLLPDDVFESDRELKYVFLEVVPDDTPVTVGRSGKRNSNLESIQEKLQELESQKSQAATAGAQEIEAIAHAIEEVRQEIEQTAEQATKPVLEQVLGIADQLDNFAERMERFEKQTVKRLEMMKGAIMTLQEDVYGIEFDEGGRIKDSDADKSTP